MRRALAYLPLALLFIAIVPSKAQKTGPTEDAEVVVVVREGAPLVLVCALRVEQRVEWRREGSSKLPEYLKVAESSIHAGGVITRLYAKAARPELAGVYFCARGPQTQRLRVVVEPRAAPTAAETGPMEAAEVVVVVLEGAPLELVCALRVEQRLEWRREGNSKLPEDLKVAKDARAGGQTTRLYAEAARPELAGVYSCARGPQAQRLRVVVEPRAAPTAADTALGLATLVNYFWSVVRL